MTYVRSDEQEADAVKRVLDRVAAFPFEIDLLLADRGFYNERVLRRSREIATTVVPVQNKGERMEEKLDTHRSYMTTYRMYKTATGNWISCSRSPFPIMPEIEASTARSSGGTWRAVWPTARPKKSNSSIESDQR
jgi:hypothetical protein